MGWGERLRRAFEAFKASPERSLVSYKKEPPAQQQINNYFIGEVTVSTVEVPGVVRDVIVGGHVTNDHSITYGTRIAGNVVIHGAVTDAFNTINNIDTADSKGQDLQALLRSLHAEVTELIKALPDAQAERAAKSLRNLTEEATSQSRDRKWFELSAEGLLDAAKAVASLTEPVTTAVKAVLAFFKD